MKLIGGLHHFLMEMARVLDLGCTLSKRTHILSDEEAQQADSNALASDWEAVGNDMRTVLGSKKVE